MTLQSCIVLAALLFSVGLYGMLTRRHAIALLLSIELMLNAANIVFVACARYIGGGDAVGGGAGPGQVFVLFAMAITVAEVAVGIALVMALYRRHHDTLLDLASEARR